MFVGVLQFGVYLAQARYMRSALAISDKAAEAAKRSADALADIERPWLIVETSEPVANFGNAGIVDFRVEFRVSNHGKGPVRITAGAAEFHSIPLPCPETLPVPVRDPRLEESFGTGGMNFTGTREFTIKHEELAAQLDGTRALMLRVSLTYEGPLKKDFFADFCWIYVRRGTGDADVEYSWCHGRWEVMRGPSSLIRHT